MRISFPGLLLLAAAAGSAHAAADPVDRDLAARRGAFRTALEHAEHGTALTPAARRAVRDHLLYPYIEYAELERELPRAAPAQVDDFLQRHAALPIAATLERQWLHELARRADWTRFLARYAPRHADDADPVLRCHGLTARLAQGSDPAVYAAIEQAWLDGGSLPAACDPPLAALARAGRITPALRWQRIELAAHANNPALVRYLARALPAADQARANAYADFLQAPSLKAQQWKAEPIARTIAVAGLVRRAQADPGAAEQLLAGLAPKLGLGAAQRGEVAYAIALWSAASYLPDTARRFAAVPAAQYDARLHEWRVREALARGDHAAARAAIAAMPEAQRREPRYRYIDARLQELAGDAASARVRYAELANEAQFHGFLAADRINSPYALCPLEPVADAEARRRVEHAPGMRRALELRTLARLGWAQREWDALLKTLDAEQRRLAVAVAVDAGWTDRAVFALAGADDLRYYQLRFPLAHRRHLQQEAQRNGLDPAWVAALIRAESAWLPDAHSHADARGLMQLIPSTGQSIARQLKIPWTAQTLYQPLPNISLGTAHLRDMLQRHGGAPYLATAAYNAGPAPIARWRRQRPPVQPDLWIETIPYRETREYVARVMAFSVIYDWRLQGAAVPLTARLQGDAVPAKQRRAFRCPTSSATIAAQP